VHGGGFRRADALARVDEKAVGLSGGGASEPAPLRLQRFCAAFGDASVALLLRMNEAGVLEQGPACWSGLPR
jgi:hypothetical protein